MMEIGLVVTSLLWIRLRSWWAAPKTVYESPFLTGVVGRVGTAGRFACLPDHAGSGLYGSSALPPHPASVETTARIGNALRISLGIMVPPWESTTSITVGTRETRERPGSTGASRFVVESRL